MGDTLGVFACNSGGRLEEPRYEGDHSADKRDRAEQEYTIIFFSRSHAMETPHCGVRSNELCDRMQVAREDHENCRCWTADRCHPAAGLRCGVEEASGNEAEHDAGTTKTRSV